MTRVNLHLDYYDKIDGDYPEGYVLAVDNNAPNGLSFQPSPADPGAVKTIDGKTISGTGNVPILLEDNTNFKVSIPVLTSAVASTTGGSINAGTYYYVITTSRGLGNTVRSNELFVVTTGTTSSVTLTWNSIENTNVYSIYRSTVSGTYSNSTFIGITSDTTFIDTLLTPTAGGPSSSDSQFENPTKSYIRDEITATTGNQRSSVAIDTISKNTSNTTVLTTSLTLSNMTNSSNVYNQGSKFALDARTVHAGGGTANALTGVRGQAIYSGRNTSGAIIGGQFSGTATGSSTSTISNVYGSFNSGVNNTNGKVSNIYGSFNQTSVNLKAKIGTMYGSYNIATNNSTDAASIEFASYGVYGLSQNTTAGTTSPRGQGGLFQVNVGNSSGSSINVTTARGLEGWVYQNVTGVSSELSGGLLSVDVNGSATNVHGLNSVVKVETTGTSVHVFGYKVDIYKNGSGNITNAYGLYLGNIQGLNRWGIYQADSTAVNYFNGKIGIGNSVPEAALDIGINGDGIILRSPNGTKYKLTVSDGGSLQVTAV